MVHTPLLKLEDFVLCDSFDEGQGHRVNYVFVSFFDSVLEFFRNGVVVLRLPCYGIAYDVHLLWIPPDEVNVPRPLDVFVDDLAPHRLFTLFTSKRKRVCLPLYFELVVDLGDVPLPITIGTFQISPERKI